MWVHAVAQLVEALRYKPDGRKFKPDGVTGIFHRRNPSDHTMALGSNQPLTEISTRNRGEKSAIAKGWQCAD